VLRSEDGRPDTDRDRAGPCRISADGAAPVVGGPIADQVGHFTAAELVDAARRRHLGVGRATVFRTLDVLEGIGAVERLDLPSGEHAYVGCEPAHHHHVVCSNCGRASEIADVGLRPILREVARQTGYRVDDHRLELFGLCPACLAARPGPTTITA
jgi:Fur family ferric uptake transcriptional regulator